MKFLYLIILSSLVNTVYAQTEGDRMYEHAREKFEIRRNGYRNEDSIFRTQAFMVDMSRFPADFQEDAVSERTKRDNSRKIIYYFPGISSKRLNTIFQKCIINVAWKISEADERDTVPTLMGKMDITSVSYLKGLDPSPQVRRFSLLVWHERMASPVEYGVELTNPNANKKTELLEFIANARITLITQLGVLL